VKITQWPGFLTLMIEFRENAKVMLDGEIRKYNILNSRFDDLASNHQELIRIKDEYKRSNQDLRLECFIITCVSVPLNYTDP
jgi:hypothetical protein